VTKGNSGTIRLYSQRSCPHVGPKFAVIRVDQNVQIRCEPPDVGQYTFPETVMHILYGNRGRRWLDYIKTTYLL